MVAVEEEEEVVEKEEEEEVVERRWEKKTEPRASSQFDNVSCLVGNCKPFVEGLGKKQ